MNPHIEKLQPYPFQRLSALIADITPPADRSRILLTLGEPKHPAPQFVLDKLAGALPALERYPVTKGETALRTAIAHWANTRFKLENAPLDAETQVIPVAGTREALFSIAQAVVDTTKSLKPLVVSPNPFYQIYEGATFLAGAEPYLINTTFENGFRMALTEIPEALWQQIQLVYVCTPGNPTGAVTPLAELKTLIELAQRHDFVIASDECYSEIYFDETRPPPGILQAAAEMGITDYRNCLAFHSLSKRSNLPGLRSGFVAGDAEIIARYLLYRTYQGCALPLPTQLASVAAWEDEDHVRENRALYRQKFDTVLSILGTVMEVSRPDAGFYLWPKTPLDEERFTRELYASENVLVLPGTYLSRDTACGNPGRHRVRMALVATPEECGEAATRIRRFIKSI